MIIGPGFSNRIPNFLLLRPVGILLVVSLTFGMPTPGLAQSSTQTQAKDIHDNTGSDTSVGRSSINPALPPPISGRPATRDSLTPADVLARLTWLSQELEAIRWYMGKPKVGDVPFLASRTSLHDNVFQALTLYDKARRFAFEQTGELAPARSLPDVSDVKPFDVWEIVNAAFDRLLLVKQALGITATASETPAPEDTVPTDVFRAVLQAGRQLNVLLDRHYEPRDVYRQVTLAIHYTARLLSQFPTAVRVPPAPPFEPGKRPRDVLNRLIECYDLLRTIAQHSRLPILTLEETSSQVPISPNDVYDMASLIVSELAYIHARLPRVQPPVNTYDPGRKFPAHVYQRAGLLQAQLLELQRHVSRKPTWLEGPSRSQG